ncbi:MAG: (2Fe-2S)-binding protein [Alphaproteobacteria bacterium]|nr:(2Fe-2S)-binding protein [Alphaproteobacteria bacterium]
MTRSSISLTINGARHTAEVAPRVTLLDFLRDVVGLTGTHTGCEHGVCGACSVLFDDTPIRACLMFAVQADGHRITTVEGLAETDGDLSLIQDCFWETHALQCGYCTPGMLIAAQALLQINPDPSRQDIRKAISGNLCRCTGYGQIVEAIELAADRLNQRDPAARADADD